MKQQFFVTVRTTGPYNANKSTKELCSLVTRQLDNTTIPSQADINTVYEYLRAVCNTINEKNPRNKALKVENPWITSYANEIYKSRHLVVKIDNFTNGDGSFLQLDFTPTRHAYGEDVMSELTGISAGVAKKRKRPNYKKWNPERAEDGDIVCRDSYDDEDSEIIIVRGLGDQEILFHAVCFNVSGLNALYVNEDPSYLTGGLSIKKNYRCATDEEIEIIFNELSVEGLRWNPATLQIEKIDP